eukprot:764837-Hanusia_phi.AAC.8
MRGGATDGRGDERYGRRRRRDGRGGRRMGREREGMGREEVGMGREEVGRAEEIDGKQIDRDEGGGRTRYAEVTHGIALLGRGRLLDIDETKPRSRGEDFRLEDEHREEVAQEGDEPGEAASALMLPQQEPPL